MLRIEPVSTSNYLALVDCFSKIDTQWFHPHPFTSEHAMKIATSPSKDIYLVGGLVDENQFGVSVYGFLRGWDDGWEIPSLGIAVASDMRGKGFGRLMMHVLHVCARARHAPSVRLRVYPENSAAVILYESLGYKLAGTEDGQSVYLLTLSP